MFQEVFKNKLLIIICKKLNYRKIHWQENNYYLIVEDKLIHDKNYFYIINKIIYYLFNNFFLKNFNIFKIKKMKKIS